MSPRPNIVLIVTDDQGYADASCQGSEVIQTPRLDRMAKEGVRFTDFHMSSAQCTPSRASILTGLYPQRVGLEGVLLPHHTHGFDPAEQSMAKVLGQAGYRTGLFGKWHLGHYPEFLPRRHGFDHFLGLPYSHDMSPPVLYRDDDIIETKPDPRTFTKRFTDAAIEWIGEGQETPFLVCLWHPMPHVPVMPSAEFKGSSKFGSYGDACQELDHHLGGVLDHLAATGQDENTLVIYTSDNGPYQPRAQPDAEVGGSAHPLRGNKSTEYEGGLRVPCVVRWPAMIPGGRVSSTFWSGLDFLPTLAAWAGAKLEQKVDGFDCRDLLTTATAYDRFYYYHYNRLDGVRSGRWKLMLERRNVHDHHFHYHGEHAEEARELWGDPDAVSMPESLFDLETEVGERTNVIEAHPEVVQRLREYLEAARDDLGDERTARVGCGRRQPGRLTQSTNPE